jgi:SAM-dependent methyltransferase
MPSAVATPAPASAAWRPGWRILGALFLAIAGSVSTALWLGWARIDLPLAMASPRVLLALVACLALTSVNLVARWLRWHFLIRRFTRNLPTRDSLAVYFATLPALLTPFAIGELVRMLILRRRSGGRALPLGSVWLAERLMDAATLGSFLAFTMGARYGLASLPIVAATAFVLLRALSAKQAAAASAQALLMTAGAWLMPVLGLHITLWLCGQPVPLIVAMKTFSLGTLFGGISGLPLGVSVTGSTMIEELLAAGVARQVGVLAILIYRIGTAWYAVLLGLACLFIWRRRLAALIRSSDGASHFDEIAHGYERELPQHVRDRLLARKTAIIERQLRSCGIPRGARGLDLGCGHGWYLGELAVAGYRMHGLDYSAGQLREAALHLARGGQRTAAADGAEERNGDGEALASAPARAARMAAAGGALMQGDAQRLPFRDGSFDFAYSVNAVHHLPSPEAQAIAFREIARVLRPGGIFLLHEMNTRNPVFRLYVGYVYPLVRQIDEGTEHWVPPGALPGVPGAAWMDELQYFTFLPDFAPRGLQGALDRLERWLESSPLRRYSAHYQASLIKR